MADAKIPDAEVVEEENIPSKPTVEKVTVIHPKDQTQSDVHVPEGLSPDEHPVRVRVESRSRHRLNVECYEIDEDGYIDIVVSDADMN